MIINAKLSDKELLNAIYNAAHVYAKLVDNTYLIIGKNKNSDYFWFQCQFHKKHFMHLLGIGSKTLKANEFYDKCVAHNHGLDAGISIIDCTPSRNHNRTTVNEKSSCCADMLRIQDAKYMKIGLKNKISQNVDFSYAYGNTATLGFQESKSSLSFPITLIPKSIDTFASIKYKIIFLFEKKLTEMKYKKLIVEIKEGLFTELLSEFPEKLKTLIEPTE